MQLAGTELRARFGIIGTLLMEWLCVRETLHLKFPPSGIALWSRVGQQEQEIPWEVPSTSELDYKDVGGGGPCCHKGTASRGLFLWWRGLSSSPAVPEHQGALITGAPSDTVEMPGLILCWLGLKWSGAARGPDSAQGVMQC